MRSTVNVPAERAKPPPQPMPARPAIAVVRSILRRQAGTTPTAAARPRFVARERAAAQADRSPRHMNASARTVPAMAAVSAETGLRQRFTSVPARSSGREVPVKRAVRHRRRPPDVVQAAAGAAPSVPASARVGSRCATAARTTHRLVARERAPTEIERAGVVDPAAATATASAAPSPVTERVEPVVCSAAASGSEVPREDRGLDGGLAEVADGPAQPVATDAAPQPVAPGPTDRRVRLEPAAANDQRALIEDRPSAAPDPGRLRGPGCSHGPVGMEAGAHQRDLATGIVKPCARNAVAAGHGQVDQPQVDSRSDLDDPHLAASHRV